MSIALHIEHKPQKSNFGDSHPLRAIICSTVMCPDICQHLLRQDGLQLLMFSGYHFLLNIAVEFYHDYNYSGLMITIYDSLPAPITTINNKVIMCLDC